MVEVAISDGIAGSDDPGREEAVYTVHATFAGAPAVQALAAKARGRLAGLPGLDLIPGQQSRQST
jgi:hypothetical protein